MVEETRRFELMKGELRPTPWEVTVSKATCPDDIWVHADSSLSQLGESCHSDLLSLDRVAPLGGPLLQYAIVMTSMTEYKHLEDPNRGLFALVPHRT